MNSILPFYKSKQLAAILIFLGVVWSFLTENFSFDSVVKIRQAIYSGDGGQLFLAAMTYCVVLAVTYMLIGIGVFVLDAAMEESQFIPPQLKNFVVGVLFLTLAYLAAHLSNQSFEPMAALSTIIFILLLSSFSYHPRGSLLPRILIAVQIFFAFQWLNIMPVMSNLYFGKGDIPISIKITGMYLDNTSILNFTGFSFFLPLMFSAFMTALLYRMHAQNIEIVRENYQKEMDLEIMQSKIMDNRIYQEINSLAHDLKTPLVTIRGLSSLLILSKDVNKLESYSERIDGAVTKMNDMITSFLYGNSRQLIEVDTLIDYIRAQIPVDNDALLFEIEVAECLPKLSVNKVRIARAMINLIENAILAPNTRKEKIITFRAYCEEGAICMEIEDNGMGIKEIDLDKIWTLGYSGKNTTGLGLAFAKQTIEENEGSITLSSIYNEGTLVQVRFPIEGR